MQKFQRYDMILGLKLICLKIKMMKTSSCVFVCKRKMKKYIQRFWF